MDKTNESYSEWSAHEIVVNPIGMGGKISRFFSMIFITWAVLSFLQIGYALTIQEATVLLAKLLAALHTDDTTPEAQPSIRLQRNRYATPRLEVEEFALLVRDDRADLLVRLANGLELPLVFPASDLRPLRELIERAESSIA